MGCASSKEQDPWELAAQGATPSLAKWLDSGGRVDAVDTARHRGSLLHAAARADQVDCIKLLLKMGATVDVEAAQHGTALHAAAACGAGNAVTLLLASGASPTALFNGRTAAEVAQQGGYPATANLIRLTQERLQPVSNGRADSRSSDVGRASTQQQQQQQQQQRAAQAARLAAVRAQLSAVDADFQRPAAAGTEPPRAASDPTELRPERSAALAATGSAPVGGPPGSWQAPGAAPDAPPARQLVSQLSKERRDAGRAALVEQQAAEHEARQQQRQEAEQLRLSDSQKRRAELEKDLLPQPAPAADASALEAELLALMAASEPAGPRPGMHSGGSASMPGTPEGVPVWAAQSGVEAATAAAAAAAAAEAAAAGSGMHLPRHLPSLPHIDSSEQPAGASSGPTELPGAEADALPSSGSGASNGDGSSAASSALQNDPLLEFVRRAMLSRPEGGDAFESGASPFASAAAPGSGVATQPTIAAQSPLHGASSGALASPAPSGRSSGGSGTALVAQRSGSLVDVDKIRHWQIRFEDLILQKMIGDGSFGRVYVAKYHETLVAVKVLLDLEEAQKAAGPEAAWTLSNPILTNLQKECGLMASLRHPNIVQFMGVSAFPPAMITEYCNRGSLADVLRAARTDPGRLAQLSWLRRLGMALDACKGMLHLHKKGIIHRDLKSPNLMVDPAWKVKVGDFNLSKIVEDAGSGRSTMPNMNPRWLAPEILNGDHATEASDVFSWGVVMWELLTLELPWPHVAPWSLVGRLMDGARLEVPPADQLPGADTARFAAGGLPAYVALMRRCWAQAPKDRPTFEEIIHELRPLMEAHSKAGGGGGGAA